MANQTIVNAKTEKSTINRVTYGHFAEHLGRCIYDGFYVREDSRIPNVKGMRTDIIEALKKIRIPCLRWSGGCFADECHWRDDIGPKESRPPVVNTHWGGVVESNHFDTHEFFDLCEMLGTEPYIRGNVGSGTVQEVSEWIEYTTLDGQSPMADLRKKNGQEKPWRLKYFGIGNENWGCGGRMGTEYYVDEVTHYNLYVRGYGDNKLCRIGTGPRGVNYKWTEVMIRDASMFLDAIALCYYTRVGDKVVIEYFPDGSERYLRDNSKFQKPTTDFDEDQWLGVMKAAAFADELVSKHIAIMDQYDPEKKVTLIVDEWGIWFNNESGTNPGFLYQQNTLRDTVPAGISLNIFNNHTGRIHITNITQTVNVLQAMVLTEGEKMILTPTYYIYDMYEVHQDAKLLDFAVLSDDYECGMENLKQINASASKDSLSNTSATLVNLSPNQMAEVTCHIADFGMISKVSGAVLISGAMNTMNTFEHPDQIQPEEFEDFVIEGNTIHIKMLSKSVVLLIVKR